MGHAFIAEIIDRTLGLDPGLEGDGRDRSVDVHRQVQPAVDELSAGETPILGVEGQVVGAREASRIGPVGTADLLDPELGAVETGAEGAEVAAGRRRGDEAVDRPFLQRIIGAGRVRIGQVSVQDEAVALILEAGHEGRAFAPLGDDVRARGHPFGGRRLAGGEVEGRVADHAIGAGAGREAVVALTRPQVGVVVDRGQRQDQPVRRLPVQGQRPGEARHLLPAHMDVDAVHRHRVGADRIGDVGARIIGLLHLRIGVRLADRRHHAQTTVEEDVRVFDLAAGDDAGVVLALARPRHPVVPHIRMAETRDRGADPAAATVEGALGAQVDGPRRGVGVHVGADRLGDFNGVDAAQRHLLEAEGARGRGAGVGVGRRHADPVDGDRGVFGRQAAQADITHRVVAFALGVHARHVADELSDIALVDGAEGFRGQTVLDVHRAALAHDGARVAVPRRGRHHHIGHRDRLAFRARAKEIEVQTRRLAGSDRDDGGLVSVTGEADAGLGLARRHACQTELAAFPGHHRAAFARGVGHPDHGVGHVLARRRIQHPSGQDAGSPRRSR